MNNKFYEGFLKVANIVSNSLSVGLRGATGKEMTKQIRSAVAPLNNGISASRQTMKVTSPTPRPLQSKSKHSDYLASIGAFKKNNPNADKVLSYQPSTTQPYKTQFKSIENAPKEKITKERGPF